MDDIIISTINSKPLNPSPAPNDPTPQKDAPVIDAETAIAEQYQGVRREMRRGSAEVGYRDICNIDFPPVNHG